MQGTHRQQADASHADDVVLGLHEQQGRPVGGGPVGLLQAGRPLGHSQRGPPAHRPRRTGGKAAPAKLLRSGEGSGPGEDSPAAGCPEAEARPSMLRRGPSTPSTGALAARISSSCSEGNSISAGTPSLDSYVHSVRQHTSAW